MAARRLRDAGSGRTPPLHHSRTSAPDHSLCVIGVYTHNLQSTPPQQADPMDSLKVFGQLDYIREADIPLIPALQLQPKYVVYSPLGETPLPPDVVLLFVNASQMLILSEAAQQIGLKRSPRLTPYFPAFINCGGAMYRRVGSRQ